MTINDLFQYALDHPLNVVFYFLLIPFAALLAGWMEREEGHLPPWNYLYSTLVYLVAVPAILAIAYTIYKWLFERGSIMDANIMLQLLPIASMLITFFIVKKQVRIESLPVVLHSDDDPISLEVQRDRDPPRRGAADRVRQRFLYDRQRFSFHCSI